MNDKTVYIHLQAPVDVVDTILGFPDSTSVVVCEGKTYNRYGKAMIGRNAVLYNNASDISSLAIPTSIPCRVSYVCRSTKDGMYAWGSGIDIVMLFDESGANTVIEDALKIVPGSYRVDVFVDDLDDIRVVQQHFLNCCPGRNIVLNEFIDKAPPIVAHNGFDIVNAIKLTDRFDVVSHSNKDVSAMFDE